MSVGLNLDIGGLVVRVSVPTEAWRASLLARYFRFAASTVPSWHLTLAHDPVLADTERPWISHDGPVTRFRVAAYTGWINLVTQEAAVSAPALDRAASALERALGYVCMQVLPREHDSVILHAAGVVMNGHGLAFFGPSGAGKSTVARLASGKAEVLTDETVIVRLGARGPTLLSTPFWGHSTPSRLVRRVRREVPLRALFALAPAPAFGLSRLAPAEAAVSLLATEKVPTERPESASVWLSVVRRLVAEVPVYQLRFRPTPELWDVLNQHHQEFSHECEPQPQAGPPSGDGIPAFRRRGGDRERRRERGVPVEPGRLSNLGAVRREPHGRPHRARSD